MNPLEMWKEVVYTIYKSRGKNPEVYDSRLVCSWWEDFNLGLSEIGYSKEGLTKSKRWFKTYISEDEIEKFNRNVMEIIRKKKDFVALFRFGSKQKVTSNKVGDFCLIAATFRFQRGVLKKVNVYYRTTEFVTKFLADLILLNRFFGDYLTSVNMKGVETEFFFSKIYTRYFHIITFYRVCRNVWKEDIRGQFKTDKGKWVGDLIESVISGKRDFKFCAAKRLAKSFKENCDETN